MTYFYRLIIAGLVAVALYGLVYIVGVFVSGKFLRWFYIPIAKKEKRSKEEMREIAQEEFHVNYKFFHVFVIVLAIAIIIFSALTLGFSLIALQKVFLSPKESLL